MTLWDFVSILVTVNNYFHDFATAVIIVGTYVMWLMLGYAAKTGGDLPSKVAALYPRLLHVTGGTLVFLLIAGIVRTFTYKEFEWHDAIATGQVAALMVKHVILFLLFAYGIFLWVRVHKKVKAFRQEKMNV